MVTGHLDLNVVEAFDADLVSRKDVERTTYGEDSRLWLQGRVPGQSYINLRICFKSNEQVAISYLVSQVPFTCTSEMARLRS